MATVRVNPSEETIRLGPLSVRFLLTANDSNRNPGLAREEPGNRRDSLFVGDGPALPLVGRRRGMKGRRAQRRDSQDGGQRSTIPDSIHSVDTFLEAIA